MTGIGTGSVAAIPQRRVANEVPTSADAAADLRVNRVVFFAGDVISASEKYAEPMKGFGGVFLPQFKTLQHGGNKGMIYKCELTLLKPKMVGQPIAMLSPQEAATWDTAFIQPAAVQNADGTWEDRVVRSDAFAKPGDNYMVYKMAALPGHDLPKMLTGTPPNGVRGVTEITALRGAEQPMLDRLQTFFFPNWDDIRVGNAHLPETTRELETHLRDRLNAVSIEVEQSQRTLFRSVGEDMIRACTAYRQYATAIFKYNENLINDGKVRGHSVAYPQIAEDMMTQFPEIRRKDDLATGAGESVTALLEMQKQQAANEAKRLELEERRIALEEAKLGVRPMPIVREEVVEHPPEPVAAVAVEPYIDEPEEAAEIHIEAAPQVEAVTDEPTADAATEVRLCGQPKNNGEPCERVLKADEEACFQHKG